MFGTHLCILPCMCASNEEALLIKESDFVLVTPTKIKDVISYMK